MEEIEIRPATAADIEAVEELTLRTFPGVFQAALGKRPLQTKVRVLAGLRLAKRQPGEGILVAMEGPTLAGVLMWATREMGSGYKADWLRVLSALGVLGILRFILVTFTVYARYRPAADEIYLYGLAVAPPQRKRGIARALVLQAEEEGRREGKAMACCFAAVTDLPARAVWRKLGYGERKARKTPWRGLVLGEPGVIRLEKALTSTRAASDVGPTQGG